MLAFPLAGSIRHSWLMLTLLAALLTSGCATTTTATVETTMHAPDPAFRFQSSDMTARVQVEFKRQ